YLPLNWYLRDFTSVGYFGSVIESPSAPAVIARMDDCERVADLLGSGYSREDYPLRPGVDLCLFLCEDPVAGGSDPKPLSGGPRRARMGRGRFSSMDGTPSFARLFTVEEANALIPELRPVVEELLTSFREIRAEIEEAARQAKLPPGNTELGRHLEARAVAP